MPPPPSIARRLNLGLSVRTGNWTYGSRRPAVLRGVDVGPCLSRWDADYLQAAGGTRPVRVHASPSPRMDFIHKNFAYKTLPFDEFIRRTAEEKHSKFFFCENEKYYLRALGNDPKKDVADIRKQFPELAKDVILPEFYEEEQFFSSVFRISSPGIQLWTHYDVMDNMLIQVVGRKRVVLFSPSDVPFLYLNGDKSEVLDIDSPDLKTFPEFSKATWHECVLEAGDVLFIPALWFHNVTSLEFGVAVNVFWRHLPLDAYDRTDTYGNKDPVAAARAVQILERALKTLAELPPDYQHFYGQRMILTVQRKVLGRNCSEPAAK
ncbi:tRNA wybutosine-synthesizing protein 5 isoform X1 [Lethenteron reissneri]|uniref:tRNA wybutosine-synthesizing protein 5 isoform X1 n=1 Tax=Lethenteron reissneri TaxID=7753 RepID=UPI002AB75BB7|nr:tRNA wybutosine-synthesizing protein 5 isoform X1 [Lethenteron reissneri]